MSQTDLEKQQIVMKFATEVQPKLFPTMAATDKNVQFFQACLDANWQSDFSIEWLTNMVNSFRARFDWLASDAKPELSKKEKLALVGLSENGDPRVNAYKRNAEIARQRSKEFNEYRQNAGNIRQAQKEAEELARTATVGNHGANADFRKLLSESFAYENGKLSWFRTLSLRRELYR